MIKLVFIFAMLLSMVAAASSGHGDVHHEGLPKVFFYQILNLGGLLVILFFVMRKKVAAALAEKKATFLEKQSSAARAKADALAKKNEIQARLSTLLTQAEQSRVNAKTEAEALRLKMMKDAEETEARLVKEAQKAESSERMKAQVKLREKLVSEAMSTAREDIKKSLGQKDLEKLQTDFVERIQAVSK